MRSLGANIEFKIHLQFTKLILLDDDVVPTTTVFILSVVKVNCMFAPSV